MMIVLIFLLCGLVLGLPIYLLLLIPIYHAAKRRDRIKAEQDIQIRLEVDRRRRRQERPMEPRRIPQRFETKRPDKWESEFNKHRGS